MTQVLFNLVLLFLKLWKRLDFNLRDLSFGRILVLSYFYNLGFGSTLSLEFTFLWLRVAVVEAVWLHHLRKLLVIA